MNTRHIAPVERISAGAYSELGDAFSVPHQGVKLVTLGNLLNNEGEERFFGDSESIETPDGVELYSQSISRHSQIEWLGNANLFPISRPVVGNIPRFVTHYGWMAEHVTADLSPKHELIRTHVLSYGHHEGVNQTYRLTNLSQTLEINYDTLEAQVVSDTRFDKIVIPGAQLSVSAFCRKALEVAKKFNENNQIDLL